MTDIAHDQPSAFRKNRPKNPTKSHEIPANPTNAFFHETPIADNCPHHKNAASGTTESSQPRAALPRFRPVMLA